MLFVLMHSMCANESCLLQHSEPLSLPCRNVLAMFVLTVKRSTYRPNSPETAKEYQDNAVRKALRLKGHSSLAAISEEEHFRVFGNT